MAPGEATCQGYCDNSELFAFLEIAGYILCACVLFYALDSNGKVFHMDNCVESKAV